MRKARTIALTAGAGALTAAIVAAMATAAPAATTTHATAGGPVIHVKPGVHVHYQESVLPIKDGVPKQKDVPKEMGGSGATVAE